MVVTLVAIFNPVPVTSASVKVTARVRPLKDATPAVPAVMGICENAPPLTAMAKAGPVVRFNGQMAKPLVTVTAAVFHAQPVILVWAGIRIVVPGCAPPPARANRNTSAAMKIENCLVVIVVSFLSYEQSYGQRSLLMGTSERCLHPDWLEVAGIQISGSRIVPSREGKMKPPDS